MGISIYRVKLYKSIENQQKHHKKITQEVYS